MVNKYKVKNPEWTKTYNLDHSNAKNIRHFKSIDQSLNNAFDVISKDPYGEMYSFKRIESDISLSKTLDRLEKLENYSRVVPKMTSKKEELFTMDLTKKVEDISIIDIKSFSSSHVKVQISKEFHNTTDSFRYMTNYNINILDLLKSSELIKLQLLWDENKYDQNSYNLALEKYVESKFKHTMFLPAGYEEIYDVAIAIPGIAQIITIGESFAGQSMTGEKHANVDESFRHFLGGVWEAVLLPFSSSKAIGNFSKSTSVGSKLAKNVSKLKDTFTNGKFAKSVKKTIDKYAPHIDGDTTGKLFSKIKDVAVGHAENKIKEFYYNYNESKKNIGGSW